jgi:hypothetical protein
MKMSKEVVDIIAVSMVCVTAIICVWLITRKS